MEQVAFGGSKLLFEEFKPSLDVLLYIYQALFVSRDIKKTRLRHCPWPQWNHILVGQTDKETHDSNMVQ